MNLFSYLIEHNRYLTIIGIFVILALAALVSKKRTQISLPLIIKALLLQIVLGLGVLKTSVGQYVVASLAYGAGSLYLFAQDGINFIFGNLANPEGPWGFIFAVRVLPVIIFLGALTSLLFHWGLVQKLVHGIGFCIRPLLGTSGAETLCAIANSFLGQTESPLLVRSYLHTMTKSEMMVVMISGMATISGAILIVFVAMGVPAQHLLASAVMSIPSSILIAKIIYPETEQSSTRDGIMLDELITTKNSFDAIARGTIDGLHLAINVGAMLIAFLALLSLINAILAFAGLSLDLIFSYLCAPFAYLLGFTGHEAAVAGKLLGTKVAINELIAYSSLVTANVSERMVAIMTYALCGFSNFSCIGIQVGGIGSLVPEKREWLTELGLYAVLGGALSNILTAMIAALLL